MFNILVLGMTKNPGGVESVIMNYYRRINSSQCKFTFLSHTDEVAYQEEILSRGDKIVQIPPRGKNIFKFYKILNNLFKENKFDAVWANICSLSNVSYIKIAKKHGVKTRIVHSHNSKNMGSLKSAVLHFINRQTIHKYATDFWACGELAGKYFYKDKILKSDKYKIIKNAIDLNKFKFDEETRVKYRKDLGVEDKLVFGHVGRYHFQKNQEFLINVFNEFQKKHDNAVLLLVGQGEDELKLKQQVKNLNIEDKVRFLGVRSDVNCLLQSFDLMVFPSLFEGLSVALLETQATGLPVFAADTISIETKVNDNLKFLSLQQSPKEWADYISQNLDNLQRDENALLNLKNKGFNIEDQVEDFIKLLEK